MSLHANISDAPFHQKSALPLEESVKNCHQKIHGHTDMATLCLNLPSGADLVKLNAKCID